MLQGLARAGADVVMHGLITPEEAQQRTSAVEAEFGVKCAHSAANVMKPAEIRCDDHATTKAVHAPPYACAAQLGLGYSMALSAAASYGWP